MFLDSSAERERAVEQGLSPSSNAIRLVETILAQATSAGVDADILLPPTARVLAYKISDCIESMVVRDGELKEEAVLEMVEALGLPLNRESGGGYSVTLHRGGMNPDTENPGSFKFLYVPAGETLPAHEHGSADRGGVVSEAMVSLHGSLDFGGDGQLTESGGVRLRPSMWVDVHKPQTAPWAGLLYEGGVSTPAPEDITHTRSLFWSV